MPINSITLRDVADLLTKLDKSSGSTTTNRVRSTLSAVFGWAMREGLALSRLSRWHNATKAERQAERERITKNCDGVLAIDWSDLQAEHRRELQKRREGRRAFQRGLHTTNA